MLKFSAFGVYGCSGKAFWLCVVWASGRTGSGIRRRMWKHQIIALYTWHGQTNRFEMICVCVRLGTHLEDNELPSFIIYLFSIIFYRHCSGRTWNRGRSNHIQPPWLGQILQACVMKEFPKTNPHIARVMAHLSAWVTLERLATRGNSRKRPVANNEYATFKMRLSDSRIW